MIAFDTAAAIVQDELAASFPGPRVLGVWMYGSRVRDEHRADSDIDLAVLCDAPLDPVDLFDASGRLAAVRRYVGVHEYRRLDPAVVRTVVAYRLSDFEALCRALLAAS